MLTTVKLSSLAQNASVTKELATDLIDSDFPKVLNATIALLEDVNQVLDAAGIKLTSDFEITEVEERIAYIDISLDKSVPVSEVKQVEKGLREVYLKHNDTHAGMVLSDSRRQLHWSLSEKYLAS